MLKTAGAIMIGGACVYCGIKKNFMLKRRYNSLIGFQNSLAVLETEISFRETELKEALLHSDNEILKKAGEKLGKIGIKEAWTRAVEECASKLCLTDGDKNTALMLGNRLGMTDTENQIKNIEGIKNMLDIHIKAAKYDVDKLCKLYMGGGVLVGVFIILVLL